LDVYKNNTELKNIVDNIKYNNTYTLSGTQASTYTFISQEHFKKGTTVVNNGDIPVAFFVDNANEASKRLDIDPNITKVLDQDYYMVQSLNKVGNYNLMFSNNNISVNTDNIKISNDNITDKTINAYQKILNSTITDDLI